MADIHIVATGNGANDLIALQGALDSAADGDVIWMSGTFDLAATDIVYLRNGSAPVEVRGSGSGAVIKNAAVKWGVDGAASVPVSVSFKNITLDGFTGTGLYMGGAAGDNRIENCTFRNYKYKASGAIPGAWPIRVEPLGPKPDLNPATITGTLTISNCVFEPPDYSTAPAAGMNNLLHLNNCNLDLLRIEHSEFRDTSWFGLAVFGITGRTEIVHNQITLHPVKPYGEGGGMVTAGIVFGGRPSGYRMTYDGSALIEQNIVTIDRLDAAGIEVSLYADGQYIDVPVPTPAREITIRDNVVHMLNPNNNGAALACLGACSHSSWTGNVVTGHARHGILISQDSQEIVPPGGTAMIPTADAPPTDNTFSDNHLSGATAFEASHAQVLIDKNVIGSIISHNEFGRVSGSNKSLWPPPLTIPCAGIACYGSNGRLVSNDFASSDIQGWIIGPKHVGCIYLAEVSSGNHIEYSAADFPNGTAHPPHRQILNEDTWQGKAPEKLGEDANMLAEFATVT